MVAGVAIAITVRATEAVLFSEPLFGVMLAAAVVLVDAPPPRVPAFAAACLAGVAAGLALLTRSVGIAAGGGGMGFLPPTPRPAPPGAPPAAATPAPGRRGGGGGGGPPPPGARPL